MSLYTTGLWNALRALALWFGLLGLSANEAPVANDLHLGVIQDHARNFWLSGSDDTALGLHGVTVVEAPKHGSLSLQYPTYTSPEYPYFEYKQIYTPNPGYFGPDAFTFTFFDHDGAVSNTATVTIQVRPLRQSDNLRVLVMVEQDLLGQIRDRAERLIADLAAEGYQAAVESELVPWPRSSTVAQLWDYLHAAYVAPNSLFGVILIGNLPIAKTKGKQNDFVYWKMDRLDQDNEITDFHIWASRVIASDTQWGSQATLVSRFLDANHAFRSGASRLPHTAYYYSAWNLSLDNIDRYQEMWPDLHTATEKTVDGKASKVEFLGRTDIDVAGADALVAGGELFDQMSHGNASVYMNGKFGEGTLFRLLSQQRCVLASSCQSGQAGGIVNNHLFTRGGGTMIAFGSTIDSYPSFNICGPNQEDALCRTLLQHDNCHNSWGYALLYSPVPFSNVTDIAGIYGDLSVRMRYAASNALPVVKDFYVNIPKPRVGEAVTFTVTFEDVDGASGEDNPALPWRHQIEWFAEGYDLGRMEPTKVTNSTQDGYTSHTHVFTTPGTYTARVEVMDAWLARGWKEVTVQVADGPLIQRVHTVNAPQGREWEALAPDSAVVSDPLDGQQRITVPIGLDTTLHPIPLPNARN